MPSVLILLHEDDPYPKRLGYGIWPIVERWEAWGIRVDVAKGVDGPPEADLVIPHVDRTVMPERYREYLDRCPRVVNRGIHDLSKRVISTLMVAPGDPWDGPVIVKTDRNHGGLLEASAERKKRRSPLGPWLEHRRPPDLATARAMLPRHYRVFDSLDEVPAEVFRNAALVVEKFVADRRDGLYYVQSYHFLGDRDLGRRIGSRSPSVKIRQAVSSVEIEPHPDIVALRHRMGFDYGKFDYVHHDGRAVLLDANATVGRAGRPLGPRRADCLAPGIWSLLPGGEAPLA